MTVINCGCSRAYFLPKVLDETEEKVGSELKRQRMDPPQMPQLEADIKEVNAEIVKVNEKIDIKEANLNEVEG